MAYETTFVSDRDELLQGLFIASDIFAYLCK